MALLFKLHSTTYQPSNLCAMADKSKNYSQVSTQRKNIYVPNEMNFYINYKYFIKPFKFPSTNPKALQTLPFDPKIYIALSQVTNLDDLLVCDHTGNSGFPRKAIMNKWYSIFSHTFLAKDTQLVQNPPITFEKVF